jgi:rubrerythrin
VTAKESCPECGSEDFDAADDAEHTRATPDRLRDHLVVYICRDCGTAWDAEKPG